VLPREKGDPVWPIGRVQTPVLAAVVRRDLAIERFEPQRFWRVEIGFAGEGTPYTALLDAGDGEALGEKAEQFASRETAAERLATVRAQAARWEVADEAKERQEKAPALFSLTALQREAAKR
jgi:DNA topoisomerase-3